MPCCHMLFMHAFNAKHFVGVKYFFWLRNLHCFQLNYFKIVIQAALAICRFAICGFDFLRILFYARNIVSARISLNYTRIFIHFVSQKQDFSYKQLVLTCNLQFWYSWDFPNLFKMFFLVCPIWLSILAWLLHHFLVVFGKGEIRTHDLSIVSLVR